MPCSHIVHAGALHHVCSISFPIPPLDRSSSSLLLPRFLSLRAKKHCLSSEGWGLVMCACVWIDIHVLPCLQLTLPLSRSHRRHVLFSGKKKKNQSGIIFCKFRTYFFFFSNLGTLCLLKPALWTDGASPADLDTVSVGDFFL